MRGSLSPKSRTEITEAGHQFLIPQSILNPLGLWLWLSASHVVIFGPIMRQIVPLHLSHNIVLLAVLSTLGAQMALPVPALASPATRQPAAENMQDQRAPDAAAPAIPAVVPVAALKQHRAGYPTTREKWRYCPRDGSHPCVDLDIPGVTEPETPTGQ
jgi:hypothetical protein